MGLTLASIVAPLTADVFMRDYWPRKFYATTASSDRYHPLYEIPALNSTPLLLDKYASPVTLLRHDGFHTRVADGRTALPFYRQGFTCYLRDVAKYVPELQPIVAGLGREIGLPGSEIKCELFCSTGVSGASMHSDYDINFQLILRGHKRWMVAANENIVNQTSICLPDRLMPPDSLQRKLAHTLPFPEEMPDDAITIDLEAGGAVFLPRGFWHQTEAIGDCLSLNFVVKGPHWISVLCRALENELINDAAWRDFAYGVCGDEARRQEATASFATLLASFRETYLQGDCQELAALLIDKGFAAG